MTLLAREKIAGTALVLSGLARASGELVEIVASGPNAVTGLAATVALLAFAFGVTGIWDEAQRTRTGRVATIATVLGALSFVGVALHSVFVLGAPPAQDVSRTAPFIVSAMLTLVGVGALALWLIRAPRYPNWVGIVLIVSVAGSVAAGALSVHPVVQPLIDLAMAACFVQFGLTMLATTPPPVREPALGLDRDIDPDPSGPDRP